MWEALLPGLINAGANIGGGLISAGGAAGQNANMMAMNQQQMALQREANAQNYAMFHENQDWQAMMSNTAYQRQMADMKLAGLNPILAYQKGGGASTPSVGAPQMQAPQLDKKFENTQGDLGRSLGAAANSAVDATRAYADVSNALENNKLIREQTAKTTADTNLANTNALKAVSETDLTKEQIKNMPFVQDLLKGQTSAAGAAAGASSAQAAATNQDARRKEQFGDSFIGGIANTVQQIFNRMAPVVRERINHVAPGPTSAGGLLRDDPNHWLYKKR